jgi:putative N-acetyltransferase (TIGR04045 family)
VTSLSHAPRSPASSTLHSETPTGCRIATTREELARHHHIRHEVFVREQGLFVETDRDRYDHSAGVIRVLGHCRGVAAGTVRLYPLDRSGRRWQGDRLAVLPSYRACGLASPLVRFAVATAAALGGDVMVAHIQIANVAFFEHLGWSRQGEQETYVGVPHQPMAIALTMAAEPAAD